MTAARVSAGEVVGMRTRSRKSCGPVPTAQMILLPPVSIAPKSMCVEVFLGRSVPVRELPSSLARPNHCNISQHLPVPTAGVNRHVAVISSSMLEHVFLTVKLGFVGAIVQQLC